MSTNEQNIGALTGPSVGAANQDAPPGNNAALLLSRVIGVETEFNDPNDGACVDSDPVADESEELCASESPDVTQPDGNGSDEGSSSAGVDVSAQKADPTVQKKEPQVTQGAVSKKIVDLYDIPRIREMEVREPNWLIEDFIIKHGLHIFSGQPGSMKSFLALNKARALSGGLDIYGTNATQTPVAYLDRENPLEVVQKRYDLLHIEDDAKLRYWGMWASEQPPTLDSCFYPDPKQRLLDWAAKYQPVIVFDSLVRFHSKKENDASEMQQITGFLNKLRFAGATVIVLHHQGKPGTEGSASPYRGSSDILAACDLAFLVQKQEQGEDAILKVESFKNRFGLPIEHRLKFDSKSGLFVPLEPPVKVDQTEVEVAAIAQFITANPGVGVEDIQKATNIGEQRLRDLLKNNPKGLWRTDVGAHNKQRYFLVEGKS